MPSHTVDPVRNIPVIVEKDVPMAVDDVKTGFPFDKDFDREESFRTQLDDIAKRHPELAGHFEGFPFRSTRRNPEESDTFRRFSNRDRPFGSRFEQFGFPFRNSSFPQEDLHDSHSEQFDQRESPSGSTQQTHPEKTSEDVSQKPPQAAERGRRPINIHQSNTTDLGQKQEPVNERNQRSMSAPPPENRSPRFTSSINIPIQRDTGATEYHSQPQGQQNPTQQSTKPTERVIPIHVEGRDEPVIPKNAHHTFTQPTSHPSSYQHPEPEQIFGNRHNLGDFMGRNTSRFPAREDIFRRQHDVPHEQVFQQQQAPKRQASPKPQGVPSQAQQPPQAQQQQPQEQKAAPQPQPQQQQEQTVPPQPPKPTPIDQIKAIQKDVSELMGQVDQFTGAPRDKQYLYLDEMLTRNLIKLDNIDTQGQENIRSARREAIKCIEKCIGILESKANANVAAKTESDKMEVEVKHEGEAKETPSENQDKEAQLMETEACGTVNKEQVDIKNVDADSMEVVLDQNLQTVEGEKKEVTATSEQQVTSDKNVSNPAEGNKDGSETVKEEPQKPEEKPESPNQSEEAKMEVDKPTENSDKPTETQTEGTSELSSQPKQEAKAETKEKKKGKKKEKSEKK